ncbi:MAG: sulfite exporter TauE/SafE family protein [Acidimicrobiia bacterium]
MPVDTNVLVLAFAVTAVAAALQGTLGFGLAVVSVPVLSLLDGDLAPVPQLLISLPLAIAMVSREWHHVDFHGVSWILAGRIPGAVVGIVLLKTLSDSAVELLIGGIVLGAVVVIGSGVTVPHTRATRFAAGTVSGATGLVASIGGPPLALLYRDAAGGTLRSSLNAVFIIGILVTVGVRTVADEISSDDVKIALVLFPAVFIGFFLSRNLKERVGGALLRKLILAVSAFAAVGVVVKALA